MSKDKLDPCNDDDYDLIEEAWDILRGKKKLTEGANTLSENNCPRKRNKVTA